MKVMWTCLVGVAALGLIACGGGEEAIEGPECGENTVEEDGACVPVYPEECAEGEVRDDELGDCVPAGEEYCGEGTELNPDFGVCVADTDLDCGEDTVDEDGDCVPEMEIACGEGTVPFAGECVAADDVCGEGTDEFDDVCRPDGDICGEGTVFDVSDRVCVPESTLACGGGTIATDDFTCVASSVFFEELAESPDLDLTDEEAGNELEVADIGEGTVFVGTIDEPADDGDEFVQDEDYVQFDAEAGQWLRLTVYSTGLPEPGFIFSALGGDYYRMSDLGAGIEVRREFAIQDDDTFEVTIGNMPHLLDELSPAGGDDWGYVGYLETLEVPEAEEVEILDAEFSGDIRDLTENFYRVQGAGEVEAAALFFGQYASDSEAQMQVWSDEDTYVETELIDGGPIAVDTSQDELYLLFDRVQAYGANVDYDAQIEQGQSAASGETITEPIEGLEPGDYVGLFQDNLEDRTLSAAIYDAAGETVASTSSLASASSDSGQNSLYWYATYETDLTLEVENASGQDIDYMITSTHQGTADEVEEVDGELIEMDYGESLSRGERHYYELGVEFDGLLSLSVEGIGAAGMSLYNDDGNLVESGTDLMMTEIDPGDYLLEVEAESSLGGGFTLVLQESTIFEVNETSSPNATIGEQDAVDTITIDSCPNVKEITMDIDATFDAWSFVVYLEDPGGDQRVLKEGSSDLYGLSGNFNETLEPLGIGEPIDVFEGANGTGNWTVTVEWTWFDPYWDFPGTLNSWGLNLTCEG